MLMETYCRQDDIMLKFDQEVLGNRANKRSRAVIPTSTSQPIEDEVFSKKIRADAAVLLDLSPEREALYQSGVHGIYSKKFADECAMVPSVAVFRDIQTDMSQRGHVKLYAFLFEVMMEQRLHYSTVLHAMALFDSVLTRHSMRRSEILLVGAACLTLVCKLEEIYPVELTAMLNQAHNIFSKDEVLSMERTVLGIMGYSISLPTRLDFAVYYQQLLGLTPRQCQLVDYLVGLSYADFNLNYCKPSQVAAAAVHYALQLTIPGTGPVWTAQCTQLTRYGEHSLTEPLQRIRAVHWHVEHYPLTNLLLYFSSDTRHQVSDIYAIAYGQMRVKVDMPKHEEVLRNPSGMLYVFPASMSQPLVKTASS